MGSGTRAETYMANIKITLKDGTVREFKHEGRAGGSYTKTLKLEDGFVIVEDEWDKVVAFPAETVALVEQEPHQGRW